MANFHLEAKIIGRSNGKSATAAAAYRAGCEIVDQRTGLVHDYTKKKGVDFSEIVAPKNAPDWVFDRSQLWNSVEKSEKRKDSQLAREIEVSIPRELPVSERIALVREYARSNFADSGMVADLCFHHAADIAHENPHCHIMLTMRDLEGQGFGNKNRSWNDPALVETWRENWAEMANKYLANNYSAARIDHRSYERQGLEKLPQKHLGSSAAALEARGIETEIGNYNRLVTEYNQLLDQLADAPTPDLLDAASAEIADVMKIAAPTFEPTAAPQPRRTLFPNPKPKPQPAAAPEVPHLVQNPPPIEPQKFRFIEFLGAKAGQVLDALRAVLKGEKPDPVPGFDVVHKTVRRPAPRLNYEDYQGAADADGRIDMTPELFREAQKAEIAATRDFSPQDWADPQARENAALEALETVLRDRI